MEALADFYGVSLDTLIGGESRSSESSSNSIKAANERSLLTVWDALNDSQRDALVTFLEAIAGSKAA